MSVEVVADEHAELGEGPVWDDATGTLVWVDILGHRVHRFDPARGSDRSIRLDEPPGALAVTDGGGLLVAAGLGFGALDESTGAVTPLATVAEEDRMNDGSVDPAGRFVAGTLSSRPGGACLYALDPGTREVEILLAGVTVSNGLAWSADGSILYYIDTPLERVDAFDYDVDAGRLSGRRTILDLHDVPGRPDGMTMDADGRLWIAMAGGKCVRCYGTDGRLEHRIDLPVPTVTSCAFGGAGLDELYVTTARWSAVGESLDRYPHAGALFRARGLGATGVPSRRVPFRRPDAS